MSSFHNNTRSLGHPGNFIAEQRLVRELKQAEDSQQRIFGKVINLGRANELRAISNYNSSLARNAECKDKMLAHSPSSYHSPSYQVDSSDSSDSGILLWLVLGPAFVALAIVVRIIEMIIQLVQFVLPYLVIPGIVVGSLLGLLVCLRIVGFVIRKFNPDFGF